MSVPSWHGITVERHYQPAGELTIPLLPEHVIALHVGQPHNAWHRRDGQVRKEWITKGHISLTPQYFSVNCKLKISKR